MIALLLLAGAGLELTVSETAGIRRFGYPVAVKLTLKDELTGKEKFRLLDGAKAVAAQFRPAGKREVWLDFNLSPGPLEKKTLRVEYGPDVEAGPEGKGGVSVEEEKRIFIVRTGGMTYTVPSDLHGLLSGVKGGKAEYVGDGSVGLWVQTEKGKELLLAKKATVVRQGPFAAKLLFLARGGEVDVRVGLTFPHSKSWVEADLESIGKARALGAELKLDLASPAWVDFGAGTGVYVALKKGETAVFKPNPKSDGWQTLVGGRPYVVGRSPFEGWAHVMDRMRCTAVAVEQFSPADEIAVDADGGLRLARRGQRLRFWMHFVPMPPHLGAVTSPQSMMSPLKVEVKGP